MPNERDEWRNRRGRGRDDRSRDERGDYGRFSADEDRGGRGRSMWGGSQELRSVGSPGIGGGTGGAWDQGSPEQDEWSPGQSAAAARRPSSGGGFRGKGPMNYQRSDQRIREDVCEYLTEDDDVDASEIDVKVEQCEVTLTGMVPSRDMKRRAERIAERASGVRDIHNQLKVDRDRRDDRDSDAAAGDGRDRKGARA
jgi:hypothetical protein